MDGYEQKHKMQQDKQMNSSLKQIGSLRRQTWFSTYLLYFRIGLKDSRVKTDNSMDMVVASFILQRIKEDAHCLCSKGFRHRILICLVRS